MSQPRPCPRCGEVAFAETDQEGVRLPDGQRRCAGPQGCNHIWRPPPQADREEIERAGNWHGELVGAESGYVAWRCQHNHPDAGEAKRCALTRLYGRYPPRVPNPQEAPILPGGAQLRIERTPDTHDYQLVRPDGTPARVGLFVSQLAARSFAERQGWLIDGHGGDGRTGSPAAGREATR